MKIRYMFTIFVMLLICLSGSITFAQDVPEIAEKALAATVYLEMSDTLGQPISYGSGFFVSPTHIVTNFHVVAGTAKATAKLVNKPGTYPIQGIIAIDQENDLALLQVTIPGIKPLLISDSKTVQIGERIFVAGNPKGLEGTFSDGIISRITTQNGKKRLQMTAPISPGSSGGPVLNSKGFVIGVTFMTRIGGQNLNFAIPSKYVKAMLDTKETAKPLASKKNISAETYYNRGNAKALLGQYTAAIADYDIAIRLKPNYALAYYNRGAVKGILGRHIAAIADYDTAIHLKLYLAEIYLLRGQAKGLLNQDFAAIADYDTAIHLEPDNVDAYYNRGLANSGLGRHSAAIADYDTAIRLKPNNALPYHSRGNAKGQLGQHFAAITDYDTAIRLKLDESLLFQAYRNRGTAKGQLGQHFAAITDYDTAIRLKPDDALAYLSRGLTKGKLGQYAAAILDYDTGIQLKPDEALFYAHRGLAKEQLGQTWEAKQDLQTALKLATQAGDVNFKNKIERALRLLK